MASLEIARYSFAPSASSPNFCFITNPTDMMKQKDEELDKKIEALRRKNEALMKRYQEVEEDKKMAEQEGMAPQSRKSEDLSITINKTTQEPRMVLKKAGTGGSSPQDKRGGGEVADGGPTQFSMGRGKRRQLFVTMVGNNKGTRVVSESADPTPPRPGGRKSSAEDEDENQVTESSRRGGRHGQSRKRTSQTQEEGVRQEGKAAVEESRWLSESDPYYQDAEWPEQPPADLTIPTSREEQLEYIRWKAEREQIDRERVARHKNAKGQWRRAWDLDKPQLVFSDNPPGEAERPQSNRGGRAPKRGSKSAGESQGHHGRGRDRKGKNPPAVVGSKAKGKERLTGRARRWDTKDMEGNKQFSETSLEEFLEELDALCDPDNPSTDSKAPLDSDGTAAATAANDEHNGVEIESITLDTKQADAASRAPSGDYDAGKGGNPEVASPKGTEKKVRFSEGLVQGGHIQRNSNTVTAETKGSLLKGVSSQMKTDLKAGAEANSTTDESQQTQTQQQQTEAQQQEADGNGQEEQDTHHVSPSGTESGSPAAPAQKAQEEKTEDKKERALETDQDTGKDKEQQPGEEVQEPSHSNASDTTETAKRVPSTETEGEASTLADQAPASQAPVQQAPVQQTPDQQAPVQQDPDQQAPDQQAPVQQAPASQAPDQQAPDQQAPVQQAPVQQAPVQQAPVQQAPVQQAPDQQAPVQQAPDQQAPASQAPEHTKTSTSRATEELIDSSLSVLSLDTGDAHQDHATSTEKAREDGKVV
ncbi:coiled-coil domain-containing protein 9B isoform X1 [Alosa sapidissima]|uniref:coiled-coil domain-containing protein 9B isoform X1 n=2 Tax=Alosa sapidissima TaxID=34773 RepID=UPI001C0923FA|nr:coiled-coil domain-containing protein 9B isoform X1 [Alosa sapidissima]